MKDAQGRLRCNVHTDDETWQWVGEYAARHGMSRADAIRRSLRLMKAHDENLPMPTDDELAAAHYALIQNAARWLQERLEGDPDALTVPPTILFLIDDARRILSRTVTTPTPTDRNRRSRERSGYTPAERARLMRTFANQPRDTPSPTSDQGDDGISIPSSLNGAARALPFRSAGLPSNRRGRWSP